MMKRSLSYTVLAAFTLSACEPNMPPESDDEAEKAQRNEKHPPVNALIH